jgi:hypothetical protein
MRGADSNDIVISIDRLDQLFNGAEINPLSKKPAVILGEPALQYAIRQELSRGLRGWQGKRLVIELPGDQVSAELQEQAEFAVRNYASTRLAQNNVAIHLSRVRSLTGLGMAIIIAGILLGVVFVILSTVLAAASDTVKGLVAGLVTIFVWSTVWNPWDRLIYEWLEPWRENRILRNILSMEIVLRPGAAG